MVVTIKKALFVLGAFLLFTGHLYATNNSEIGIVLLHAKGVTYGKGPIQELAERMEGEGFKVISPEMPWSRDRIYDKTYEDSMNEINTAAEELKNSGVKKIIVAGQSLGANAALYYGTLNSVDGIIAISPGHVPDYHKFQKRLKGSPKKAKRMIEAGKGDKEKGFVDINKKNTDTVYTTANIYYSYFNRNGNAVMSTNAANLQEGNPLLWIIGTRDRGMMIRGRNYAFNGAPENPMNKYIEIDGGTHKNTPVEGADEIIAWIEVIAAK